MQSASPTKLSDRQLLKQIAAGNVKGLENLMRRYEPRVYQFVIRFVKDGLLAEEITQDIFIKLWENRRSWKEIESFDSWLHIIARNKALNALQALLSRQVREEKYATDADWYTDGNKVIEERDFNLMVRNLTAQLPPRCKEVFLLKKEQGLSNEEIGSRLNISTNTVKNQLKKSYSILRKLVTEQAYLILLVWCLILC